MGELHGASLAPDREARRAPLPPELTLKLALGRWWPLGAHSRVAGWPVVLAAEPLARNAFLLPLLLPSPSSQGVVPDPSTNSRIPHISLPYQGCGPAHPVQPWRVREGACRRGALLRQLERVVPSLPAPMVFPGASRKPALPSLRATFPIAQLLPGVRAGAAEGQGLGGVVIALKEVIAWGEVCQQQPED